VNVAEGRRTLASCSRDWFLKISRPFEQVVPAGHARARVEEIEGREPDREPVIETDRSTREVSEAPRVLFMSDHPLLNDHIADPPAAHLWPRNNTVKS